MSQLITRRSFRFASTFLLLMFLMGSLIAPTTPAAVLAAPGNSASANAAAPQSPSTTLNNILDIPLQKFSPKVDGNCDPQTEYAGAKIVTFNDGAGKTGTVYLEATPDMLYVCMFANNGSFDTRFGSLYVDPQGDGGSYVYANKGDDAFRVDITSVARSSYVGSSLPNGWTLAPAYDSYWSGSSIIDKTGTETVEWGIKYASLNFGKNCTAFGLSVFHHWFASTGDDYHWIDNAIFDQPRTWQLAEINSGACSRGDVAYVFRGNTLDAVSYKNLLTTAGYTVALIPLADVAATDFTVYKFIIIADDTGSLNTWGTPPDATSAAQIAQILSGKKPILGLGEGGYAFFGRLHLFIGWPMGWHGPIDRMAQVTTSLFGALPNPVIHYTIPVNSVDIYLAGATPPSDVTVFGKEVPETQHSPLIQQGCRMLWGGSGNPLAMSADGQDLFLKVAALMFGYQCAPDTTPPPNCTITVTKTANPADGTPVTPGTAILYTITYTIPTDAACGYPKVEKLLDVVPGGTTYVPNSASDSLSPAPDGSMVWAAFPGTGSKSFKVVVGDQPCAGQKVVNNQATLFVPSYAPVLSNTVSHPVTCPNVTFPSQTPFYAESELEVHPYPLTAGVSSDVNLRLTNNDTSAALVAIDFQISPLGIGLPFTTFATRMVSLPAHSNTLVTASYLPTTATAGQACFQAAVHLPTGLLLIKTQSCLDMAEDFSANLSNMLIFNVGNPKSFITDITLVVDNTCPGWSAVISSPPGGILTTVGPNDTDIRQVKLLVTPPSPVTLGTGCHIDMQAWIINSTTGAAEMIGGIRKLDVPPVHLPPSVTPIWEEPEISFIPNPPVLGAPNQLCIQLVNPLAVAKTVTVAFSAADFGAGIGFTPVATQNFTLPPMSSNNYCITWTPSTTGTLHRCILVVLTQPGYQAMHSQRNVNLVRIQPSGIGSLKIPIMLGNPDLVNHALSFNIVVTGIDPYWTPVILPVGPTPGPAPTTIGAGQTLALQLVFLPPSAAQSSGAVTAPPADFRFGDTSQVSVGMAYDGIEINGFTVQIISPHLYLPLVTH